MPPEPAPAEALRTRPAPEEGELIAVLRSPHLLNLVQDSLRHIGAAPARVVAIPEAMALLVGPGRPPLGLLCEAQPEEDGWRALQDAARDPFSPTRTLILGAPQGMPEDPAALVGALRALTGRQDRSEAAEVDALRRGLAEGEVAMRYQPIVRMSDGAPVALEGLVRWLRPDGPQGATALGPDAFVPMAERGGLANPLARAVAHMAAAEMRALHPHLVLPVTINLPLEVVLRHDTAPWLERLCHEERLRPRGLGIELTETSPVRDAIALRRAVLRLRQAGHPVWVDDMSLEENRDLLFDLPFTGIKLDRFLVGAIPHSHRARAEVRRLIGLAHERGMIVTAEGVTSAPLWRALALAGADNAQGYAVGRPLPASALPAWNAAWRRSGRMPAPGAE
ncbi:EAL domain, c-di-GMP-specific phosphodiesterase class I (or its enzymatically inactive variant) [Roseomonas rosea]|uniref:EAL domain, c-di-GMP-specific phosphodiesterase class I (Or its enzymatically inactive variant) n=1 Tax=Muricoccus roseus TaxID=198092 RepID=A0A1M6Q5W7_9PROT|nr:EAL domain, c-di-GMP-specific phosphodiesterase class I (or its enzymatically inactive variant) [Roseomonas rosea]